MYGNSTFSLADRGGTVDLACDPRDAGARWLAVSRMGHLRTGGSGFSIWLQLRGRTRVLAREGDFSLCAGEWIALDRDSAPELQAGRYGATIGLLFPAVGYAPRLSPMGIGGGRTELLPGRGCISMRDLRIAMRLWRNGRSTAAAGDHAAALRALQSMLLHLSALQGVLDRGISRSPGRSVRRKRQVFGRLQRARLYLDGHRDRVVRLTELAELTSFSSWYLSKTFHEIYDESPQAASVRLRLERACELLASSNCSISEVGAACGFDNSCSFARAFRARHRTTATAYREASRQGAKFGTGMNPATKSDRSVRTVLWSGL